MHTKKDRYARARKLGAVFVTTALAAALSTSAGASSHREAPFISTMPQVDATDFYMFNSYEAGRTGYVTIVANYLPLQDAYGGPNYFKLDPNALYEIHIVNDGGAVENITYQFKFQSTLDDNKLTVGGKQVSIPIVQNGSADVAAPASAALNVHETYTLNVIYGPRRQGTPMPVFNTTRGTNTFDKPVDNIGTKTISNYVAYGNKHVWDIRVPGCDGIGRVFVGQRRDPFVVNLGETFDLVNIKYPATELNAAAEYATVDSLIDKNVTAIELELPVACLTQGKGTIIGGWTSASIPASRVVGAPTAGLDGAQKTSGDYVQVSRLGMPLVNEIVIGLKDKNKFNNSEPKDDGQFIDYVTNPTLPALLEILFGGAGVKAPTNFPRTDLIAAFLTGVEGLNKPANVVGSEMLRLNTAVPAKVAASQDRLGVLNGDNAGFPNGRRPGDDVVDIELRVAMGVLCTLNIGGCKPADAPAGTLHYTDGAFIAATFFPEQFPYLQPALPGSPNPDNAIKRAVK
jgi:Domain of unknown function (DUF4331)